MRPSDIEQIRALPLFRDMSDSHFAELIRAGFLQRFPEHVLLFREGEMPDFLHIVVEGNVEQFSVHADHETTIDILRPVSAFILAAVVQDDVYLKSARTIGPCRILMIPAEAVRAIFGRDAGFARAVVAELATRYRGIVRALKNQKLRTGTERLANWILDTDRHGGNHGRFTLPYDKRTLASLLGMTPENLSRNLGALSGDCIANEGRDIVITDRDKLTRCATPNPLIDMP